MLTSPDIPLPTLPAAGLGWQLLYAKDRAAAIATFQLHLDRRLKWLNNLERIELTDSESGLRRRCYGQTLGDFDPESTPGYFPWRFHIGAGGNVWWPTLSRALAATTTRLCGIYTPTIGGIPLTSFNASNALPLGPGARTYALRVWRTTSRCEVDDGDLAPVVPAAIDVINYAFGSDPESTDGATIIPWVDVPPAAPSSSRVPTYHFSLWFRYSLYTGKPESSASGGGSGLSNSRNSQSSQSMPSDISGGGGPGDSDSSSSSGSSGSGSSSSGSSGSGSHPGKPVVL